MFYLLSTILVICQATDGIMTKWAHDNLPGFVELNPIVAPIAGDWTNTILKVGGVIIGLLLIRKLFKSGSPTVKAITYLGLIMSIGLYALVIGSNFLEILI